MLSKIDFLKSIYSDSKLIFWFALKPDLLKTFSVPINFPFSSTIPAGSFYVSQKSQIKQKSLGKNAHRSLLSKHTLLFRRDIPNTEQHISLKLRYAKISNVNMCSVQCAHCFPFHLTKDLDSMHLLTQYASTIYVYIIYKL